MTSKLVRSVSGIHDFGKKVSVLIQDGTVGLV